MISNSHGAHGETERRLAGEIAARLIEWQDIGGGTRSIAMIQGFAELGRSNPFALRLACEVISGSSSILTQTYQEIGPTRQNGYQQMKRAISKIGKQWPDASRVIVGLISNRPRGPKRNALRFGEGTHRTSLPRGQS